MRDFCLRNNFDVVTISRLERGRDPVPESTQLLCTYAESLGLPEGTASWTEFMETAAQCYGITPNDLSDEELFNRLPAFVHRPMSREQADGLIDKIRRA